MLGNDHPLAGPMRRLAGFLILGAILLTLGGLWFLRRLPSRPPAAFPAPTGEGPVMGGNGSPTPVAPAPASPASAAAPATGALSLSPAAAEILRTIEQCLAVLRDPANADKPGALSALRQALDRANRTPEEAAAAIAAVRAFLAGGEDAPTGERFRVTEGGALAEAPTLRTLLMDGLGALARTANSAEAAQVARETLGRKDSADEWALSLRNLAWADPAGSRTLIAGKVREMLAYEPWQQSPSAGFLEAFDIAAYSGDATLMADLAKLSAGAGPTRRAALVGADRLSATAPVEVANYLNANPSVLADRPLLRADYMGKLDLADAAHRALAEAYLDRTDVTLAEKSKFLARLETPAGFGANSLLTSPQPVVGGTAVDRRAGANRAATEWLSAGRFPTLQAPLADLARYTAAGPP